VNKCLATTPGSLKNLATILPEPGYEISSDSYTNSYALGKPKGVEHLASDNLNVPDSGDAIMPHESL
jgi:hypothetical protein